MKIRSRYVQVIFAILAVLVLLFSPGFFGIGGRVALAGDVCPEGGDWSEHQSGSLQDVGAENYCVKGGNVENTEGCTAYLEEGSFSTVQAIVNADGACGLSHWSYELPPPPPTDPPTATDEPTATSTDGPSPTPTETPGEGTPTATPEPTDKPDKPDRHPATGPEAVSFEVLFGLGIVGLGAIGYGAAILRRNRK